MTRARDIANLVDANGDIVAGALDNVPAADVVNDTTPQLGGDLQSNSNDVVFADNDKAIFGAGSDLQIYHDGSNSNIYEAGTGDLTIQTDGTKVGMAKASPFEWMLEANVDADVKLYYDGNQKLATTSTGIDVTGNVTVDAEGGSATVDVRQGSAKAWLCLIGTGSPVSDSLNTSSVTDNGLGNFTQNYSSSFSNNDYSFNGSADATFSSTAIIFKYLFSNKATGSSRFITENTGAGSNVETDEVCTTTHGDLA